MAGIDPLGATVGIIALFSTCMQCFEYVQYGKKFGDSLEQYDLQLALAELRLSRWAESVGIRTDMKAQNIPQDTALSNLDAKGMETVATLLGGIKNAFDRVQEMAQKYENKHPYAAELQTIDPADDLPTLLGKLALSTKARSRARQKTARFMEKTRFALFEKSRFNELIVAISSNTQDLIEVFPADVLVTNRALAEGDAAELAGRNKEAMGLLRKAAEGQDEVLNEIANRNFVVMGSTKWEDVVMKGKSQAWLGHDVSHDVRKDGDTYSHIIIDGETRVHLGSRFRGKGESAAMLADSHGYMNPQNPQIEQFSRHMMAANATNQEFEIKVLTSGGRADTMSD